MKKYNIKVNDQTYLVEIEQTDPDNLNVSVNNNIYSVAVQEILELNQKNKVEETKNVFIPVTTNSHPSVNSDNKSMSSPMSGLILDLKIKQNQEIKNGDLVCVIEAMKMESEVYSSVTGKIKSIFVENNAAIKTNDKIFEIF